MKLKRALSLFVIFVMVLVFCPADAAEGQNAKLSGKLGDDIIWTVEDGVMTVSGQGATYDFEKSSSVYDYVDSDIARQVYKLIIEEGIARIGKNTFSGFNILSEIAFPKSLEEIGDKAFWGTYVKNIAFPEGSLLRKIGTEAFKNSWRMETADLSSCLQLETLSPYSFMECSELSTVLFASNSILTKIPEGAFRGCTSLLGVVIPTSVTSIGEYAFWGCFGLHYVSIPAEVSYIGQSVFAGATPVIYAPDGSYAQSYANNNYLVCVDASYVEPVPVLSGTLSNGITWSYTTHGTLMISGNGGIEDFESSAHAPWYCLAVTGMNNLVISEGITHIGERSFQSFEKLKTVTLPSTLKTIGKSAFYACRGIEKLVLPEGFAKMGDNALYACESLRELVIPSSMYSIGGWALYGLDSVEKYTVSPANTAFSSDENGVLYNGDKTAIIKFPASSPLKSYTIPASVSEIYPNAFNKCNNIEEIKFEEGSVITLIGYNAFSDSSIKSITLPSGVKSIAEAAFDNCSHLENVVLPDGLTEIKDSAFRWSGLTSIVIPGTVSAIGNSAFYGCKKLESVTLADGITAIGAIAFANCASLKKVYLPQSLLWLDSSAFHYSNSLEKISVSEHNPYYYADEYGAVYYCGTELIWYPKLSNNKICIIPEGVTVINYEVFERAANLEEIVLPSTISSIEAGSFRGCSSLEAITIPKRVTELGGGVFEDCVNLSAVTFEEGAMLSCIGAGAFSGCKSLEEITIPSSVVDIKNAAFARCTSLKMVHFTKDSKLESFSDYAFTDSHFVTIYAPEDTVAKAYAEKNRLHVPLTVNVDGNKIVSDVPPMIVNFRTMVPMRAIFEALDAEVSWDETVQMATAKKGNKITEITVGSYVMTADGKELLLDSPAFIFEDRIMIPARAVSEALGYDVSWNEDIKTVNIISK